MTSKATSGLAHAGRPFTGSSVSPEAERRRSPEICVGHTTYRKRRHANPFSRGLPDAGIITYAKPPVKLLHAKYHAYSCKGNTLQVQKAVFSFPPQPIPQPARFKSRCPVPLLCCHRNPMSTRIARVSTGRTRSTSRWRSFADTPILTMYPMRGPSGLRWYVSAARCRVALPMVFPLLRSFPTRAMRWLPSGF